LSPFSYVQCTTRVAFCQQVDPPEPHQTPAGNVAIPVQNAGITGWGDLDTHHLMQIGCP
jgi:hypothetical protein